MMNFTDLSASQLNNIIAIKEQIEKLQSQMESIASGNGSPAPVVGAKPRRRMSRAGRNRIIAAVKARWAKFNKTASNTPKKGGRRLSAAGRAAIVAATKARWARVKGQKAKPIAPKSRDRRSSPAVRAKLAAAAKARWAKAKAAGKTAL